MGCTAEQAKCIREIWDDEGLEPGIKITMTREYLEKNNLGEWRVLVPDKLLCHPDNRGGSMLNFHDVHLKGAKMIAGGCRVELLVGGDCFTL